MFQVSEEFFPLCLTHLLRKLADLGACFKVLIAVFRYRPMEGVSLYHRKPPPSRSLPQLPSSNRCDPGVVPSLFVFSVPGDLVHFESSPGALALQTQSFHH